MDIFYFPNFLAQIFFSLLISCSRNFYLDAEIFLLLKKLLAYTRNFFLLKKCFSFSSIYIEEMKTKTKENVFLYFNFLLNLHLNFLCILGTQKQIA